MSDGVPLLRQRLTELMRLQGLREPHQILPDGRRPAGARADREDLLRPGDLVLCESPTYVGAIQAFQSYQVEMRSVPTDDHGLIPPALVDMLRSLDVEGAGRSSSTSSRRSQSERDHTVGAATSGNPRHLPDERPADRRRRPYAYVASRETRFPLSVRSRPKGSSTSARSRKSSHRACASAGYWLPRRCGRGCCSQKKRRTCARHRSRKWWQRRISAPVT